MNRSGLLASSLVLLMGCEVRVNVGGDDVKVDRAKLARLLEELQIKTGVEGTDERCPDDVQKGKSYTCQVRTVLGEQLVDLSVDGDGTAHADWHRVLVGGATLASKVATFGGIDHTFDCTGQVLDVRNDDAVVICAEVGREHAHVVVRGSSGEKISAVYYDDLTAPIEAAVGGLVERIDCPDAATIRNVAPFACDVWRDGRMLAVELTHAPDGWEFRTADLGPIPGR